MPLGKFLTEVWLPGVLASLQPHTRVLYAYWVRQVASRDTGAVRLRDLTARDFNALYEELARCGNLSCRHAGTCRGLGTYSIRTLHFLMLRALRDAVGWEMLARNPVAFAKPPAEPERSHPKAWTADQLKAFLHHVRRDRLFALWRLAATTGMRRGELLGLAWRTVDLERGTVRVERALTKTVPYGYRYGPPKTWRGRRTIVLDPATLGALRAHRLAQLNDRQRAGDAYHDEDLVFCKRAGGPIHPATVTNLCRDRRRQAGLPFGSLHTLRHTMATLALTATAPTPIHVVARRLGDDPETVLKNYSHLLPDVDVVAADAVATQLGDPTMRRRPKPVPRRGQLTLRRPEGDQTWKEHLEARGFLRSPRARELDGVIEEWARTRSCVTLIHGGPNPER